MKKVISLAALLLVLIMLFCACGEQPKDIDESTAGSTDNSTTTTSAEEESTSAALSIEKYFYNLLNTGLYRRALGCTFEKPEDVPVWFYFYTGISNTEIDREPLTDEEDAFTENVFGEALKVGSVTKLPVAEINKDLSILGVTVEDIQIPDRWKYYDKTDSYYFCVSDAYGVGKWSLTKAEEDETGKVTIYWQTIDDWTSKTEPPIPGELKAGAVKMVMTLQQQADGTYRVLSNLPQE